MSAQAFCVQPHAVEPNAEYGSWPTQYASGYENLPSSTNFQNHEPYAPTVNWWGENSHIGNSYIDPTDTVNGAYMHHQSDIMDGERSPKRKRPSKSSSRSNPSSNGEASSKSSDKSSGSRSSTGRSSVSSGGSNGKGKTTASRGRRAAVPPAMEDDTRDVGREIFLMRNRQAAERCRAKKKMYEAGLQEQVHELEVDNAGLKEEAMYLQDQILSLKTECLRHVECNCTSIRGYLVDGVDSAQAQAGRSRGSVDSSTVARSPTTLTPGFRSIDEYHSWGQMAGHAM